MNKNKQRFYIYVEYFSCNSSAFFEIFSHKILRFFQFNDDDDEDEIHFNLKKRFV
jgi:hypothetical protein